MYRLRHCGRKLKVREHPSAYGQMGRCVSPCLGDLDPNAYRRQLDMALGHFEEPGAGEALIEELDARMREAAAGQRFERAAALLRRKERLAWVVDKLEGMLRATHAEPRLVLARHPVKERFDAFWIVQGRLVDWGSLPGPTELAERTEAALSRRPGRAAIPADEIDEMRIVASWVAEHEPPRACARSAAGRRRTTRIYGQHRGRGRLVADRPLGGLEPDLRVRLVAERLRRRGAAAAQHDAVALRDLELVAVGVDDRHRPRDLVRAVPAHLDDHLLHAPILARAVQRVAHIDHPEVHEIVPSHHCVVRFRQRRPVNQRGGEAVAEALIAALEDADVSRWPPGWAVSDRHTELWAVTGKLAFPLERSERRGRYVATTCLSAD